MLSARFPEGFITNLGTANGGLSRVQDENEEELQIRGEGKDHRIKWGLRHSLETNPYGRQIKFNFESLSKNNIGFTLTERRATE